MKPAWDKLMEDFKNSKSGGVYDVDCTADGKTLCEEAGVSGYPTIKYGDPSDKAALQKYEKGREYEDLKTFADETLGPICGPKTLDACSDEDKAQVEAFMAQPAADLAAGIKKLEKTLFDKRKELRKRKSKFDAKLQDFQEVFMEHTVDVATHEKAKQEFEKKAAKASKQEKNKQAEKDKKLAKAVEKMTQKESDMSAQTLSFEKEVEAIEKEAAAAGLKYMKIVHAQQPKVEL